MERSMTAYITDSLLASFEEAHRQHPYLFACAGCFAPDYDSERWRVQVLELRANCFFSSEEGITPEPDPMGGEFEYGESILAVCSNGGTERFFLLGRSGAETFYRLATEAWCCLSPDVFHMRSLFGAAEVREAAKEEAGTSWLSFVFQALWNNNRLIEHVAGHPLAVVQVGMFRASLAALAALQEKHESCSVKRSPGAPRRNDALYAWVNRQRSKKSPVPWEKIWELALIKAAKDNWVLPPTLEAMKVGMQRYLRHKRETDKNIRHKK
jgi:hypothetical protein